MKESVRKINELISISVINQTPNFGDNQIWKNFDDGSKTISFIGLEPVRKYLDYLQILYSTNKEVEHTVSLKKFEQNLIALIRNLKNRNTECKLEDFNQLINGFLELELIESEVLYEVYGLEMESDALCFGDFIVYNYSLSEEVILEKCKKFPALSKILENRKSNFFLCITVNARDNHKAIEIADSYVESFENAVNYMIADLDHQRSIGVFNFRGWKNTNRIICNSSKAGIHISNDIFIPVNIEEPFFRSSTNGNDKIWSLITKKDKNEIEKRLLLSIEWIGKGVYDKDYAKALVQFVFSIEGMLHYDERGFITPSIVSQISDWLAFITRNDPVERKEVVKYFKQIYQKRSAIVHGGKKSIDLGDVVIALKIAKQMVVAFLTKNPYCHMRSINQLKEHIDDLKFN